MKWKCDGNGEEKMAYTVHENYPYQVRYSISHCPLSDMVCVRSSPKYTTYHLHHHCQPIALVASCMCRCVHVCVREGNSTTANDLPVTSTPQPLGIGCSFLHCISTINELFVTTCLSPPPQVEWLISDELISVSREASLITPHLLQAVATHVQTSGANHTNCFSHRVPLKFVFGATHSMTHFVLVSQSSIVAQTLSLVPRLLLVT